MIFLSNIQVNEYIINMQFLKQIKGKALGVSIFDKKPSKQQTTLEQKVINNQKDTKKNGQKQSGGYLNSISIKSIAKSWFHKYKPEDQQIKQSQQKYQNYKQISINGQTRFWQTASPHKQTQIKGDNVPQQQEQIIENIKQQNIQVDEQSAAQFVANLCKSTYESEKQNKMRVSKARNAIFGNLQIQPIYMSENCQAKILKMQLQLGNQLLIQRTQALVLEKNNVDRAIEKALVSGYLWQANFLPNKDFVQACYETINKGTLSVNDLSKRVQQARNKIKLFSNYFSRVNALNQKRVKIAQKLKLLAKIKQYKKDITQKFQNIDQAFYIERNRQKLHTHIVLSQNFLSKVLIMQNLVKLIKKQNEKLINLIQTQLRRWIDKNENFEKKHIEKILILCYFVKNQKMYTKNGFELNLNCIRDKQKLIKQISAVKNWQDYKYVNDKTIKLKVSQFLNNIIKQLQILKLSSTVSENFKKEKRNPKIQNEEVLKQVKPKRIKNSKDQPHKQIKF